MPLLTIRKDNLYKAIKRLLDFVIVFSFILIVFTIVTGGFSKHFFGIKISVRSLENPIIFISLFVFIRLAISLKIKDFLLLIGSVLLCLFAIEFFLRVWNAPIVRPALLQIHRESPIFGWEHIPNVSGVGKLGTKIGINSYGFRGTEHQLKKDENVYRIMAVGDSFTFGMAVNLEDTFSKQLETLLNNGGIKSEVINCGVIGYVMWQNFEVLRHKVLPFKPDLVILAVFFK